MWPSWVHTLWIRTYLSSEGLILLALFFPDFLKGFHQQCHIFLMFSELYLLWVHWTIFKPALSSSQCVNSSISWAHSPYIWRWAFLLFWVWIFSRNFWDLPLIRSPFPHRISLQLPAWTDLWHCSLTCSSELYSNLNKHITCGCFLFFFEKNVGIFKSKLLPCSYWKHNS